MPQTVDQSITAALDAETLAAAQRRAAIEKALAQATAPPLDINPQLGAAVRQAADLNAAINFNVNLAIDQIEAAVQAYLAQAAQDAAQTAARQTAVYIKRVAAQNIVAYRLLTTNVQGQAIYADATIAEHVEQVLGVAETSALSGAEVSVVQGGVIQNMGWNWVPEKPVFLGAGGDLSQSLLATRVFTLQVGYAVSPTELFIRLGRGVLRNG